jgi:sialic acid synthase SpsE
MEKVYVIAECCQNHMGSMDLAKKMIAEAKEAGATMVKFQLLKADLLFKPEHPLYSRVKEAELTIQQLAELKGLADALEIDFFATPFYLDAVGELESIGVKRYKIREKDSANMDLINKVLETGKEVFISTTKLPLSPFLLYHPQIKYLYCLAKYPPEDNDLDLKQFEVFNGFSDHFPHISAAIAATSVALTAGCNFFVLEKHVTLSHDLDNLDKAVSIDFTELKELVTHVRRIEKMVGEVPELGARLF